MRQPTRDQLGEAGQKAVELFFNDLGWGPIPTGKHDLGTDLFVQVREVDLTDLGMLLGVQVKTGDSWFGEPTSVGGREGWWFREKDRSHETYWVNHHIPHILIVQDESRTRRYWVSLNRSTIERTPKGLRVFVPDDQGLDAASAQIWTEIVAAARAGQSLEGARWNFDLADIPEDEWARYALLASRIVAPHPNRGITDHLTWPEAIALCIQVNPTAWDEASSRGVEPTPTGALEMSDPGWKLAGAIHSWMAGSTSTLESMDTRGFPEPLQVAHAVCLAMILEDRDEWHAATIVLDAVRRRGQASADQAWVSVQLGWALFDIGRLEEARTEFQSSLAMHASFPSSVTNSAIRSAGILALFDMAPLLSGDVASAVQASDTTLSWWRTQQIESGLNSFLKRAFKQWAHDGSVTFGGGDDTVTELYGAELSARLVGNRRSSQYAQYLRAIAGLALPGGSHVVPAQQLELLRRAGYSSEVSLAVQRLRSTGPLPVVSDFMRDVSLRNATTTSIRADLKSLSVGGSYSSSSMAQEWISYLLPVLFNPAPFAERFNLEGWLEANVLEAIAGLHLHLTDGQFDQILHYALGLPQDASETLRSPLRRLWGSSHLSIKLASRSTYVMDRAMAMDDSWVRTMFLNLGVSSTEAARRDLHDRIMRGELGSLPDRFSIDALTTDEAKAIVAWCARVISGYEGQLNSIAIGAIDPYRLVAQLAVFGPFEAREDAWAVVAEGIAADNVIHERKSRAAQLLGSCVDEIPRQYRTTLLGASDRLRHSTRPETTNFFFPQAFEAPGPAFTRLYLELSTDSESDEWRAVLGGLLTGNSQDRCAAIEVMARRDGYELLLLALTRDSDTDVSNEAMSALSTVAVRDAIIAKLVVPELLQLLAEGGEDAALSIGRALVGAKSRVAEADPLVEALRQHESLQIRSLAGELEA